jgi:oligosaccharide repeat unit polymerase
MNIIFALILGFMCIVFFIAGYKKTKDLFSPICFFCLLTFIRIIPRLLELQQADYISEFALFKYFVMQVLVLISLIFGLAFYEQCIKRKDIAYELRGKNYNALRKFGIFMFLLGSVAKVYLIIRSGGYSNIYSNINLRAFMLRGTGYIGIFSFGIDIGLACCLKYWYESGKKTGFVFLLIIMFILAFFFKVAFGQRSPILNTVMLLIMTEHYSFKKFKLRNLLKPKTMIIIVLSILFIVMMPMIRYQQTRELYLSPLTWMKIALTKTSSIIHEISEVDRDIFTFEYFRLNEKWHGKSFIDLLYAPIPSGMMPLKPPVDDGVYLANLIKGFNVKPSMPFQLFPFKSSIPFSTAGIMYANFGVIGVVIAHFLIGISYQYTYGKLKDSNYSIMMIIIYQLIIYNLRITNLSIVQTSTPVIFTYLVFKIFIGFNITKTDLNKLKISTNNHVAAN